VSHAPKLPATRPVRVAAAVIRREDGAVLLARRRPQAHQGGLWEFPGGKLEAGERVVDALARELGEELGIHIDGATPLIRVRHAYPDKLVDIATLEVRAWRGQPHGREGQPVRWVAPRDLAGYRLPAANRPILTAALLPRVAVLADFAGDGADGCIRRVDACLDAGAGLIRLRLAECAGASDLGRELVALCHRRGALLVLEGSARAALAIGADGVHLSREAAGSGEPPPPALRVSVDVETLGELLRAARGGADFAFAHADDAVAILDEPVREAHIPLYARASPATLATSVAAAAARFCHAGCQGIALDARPGEGFVQAIGSARTALRDTLVVVTRAAAGD